MPNKVRTILILVVALVWGANFTAPIFIRDYTPPNEVHIVFMAVLGGLVLTYRREHDEKPKTRGESIDLESDERDRNSLPQKPNAPLPKPRADELLQVDKKDDGPTNQELVKQQDQTDA